MKFVDAEYRSTKNWIYRNARPIDLARWQYHFENGAKENVLNALSAYQNVDGGFAYALEADAWNPNSSPIQTWAAVEILREIDFNDRNHQIIQGILRYLDSGVDFAKGKWNNTIPSNNDYPHAFWWDWKVEIKSDYNPTANLAGFIIKYADVDSSLYQKGCHVAKAALQALMDMEKAEEGHLLLCYFRLMQCIEEANASHIFDINAFKDKLTKHVQKFISNMQLDWICDGVAFELIKAYRENLGLISDNGNMIRSICDDLRKNKQADGTWDIAWEWNDYSEQWAIAKNWWKAYGVIANMLFLKQFHSIEGASCTEELMLVTPSKQYIEDIIRYQREFLDHGDSMDGTAGLKDAKSIEEWLSALKDNSSEDTVRAGLVPASTFLGIRTSDNRVVGMIDIRHRLNDYLLKFGGHIGYSVRKSERQKGYAKEMLRLALLECNSLGITKALITCYQTNIASARTILANGGVLENEVVEEGKTVQRYWIAV